MAPESKQLVENMDPHVSAVFQTILEATAAKIGEDYFRAIVKHLTISLDCWGAWVTELEAENRILHPIAWWAHNEYIHHDDYCIDGTPCEHVIDRSRLHYVPDHAVDLYPEDTEMAEIGVVSYIGMPLIDSSGKIMGHIAIMDTKPLLEKERIAIFELFGERATAEMRRLKTQNEIEEREEQLRLMFESALDGFLILDADLTVTSMNPAAINIFGCSESEDLQGESILDFLNEDSQITIETIARKLLDENQEDSSIWIPDALTARKWDNSEFPAEASLSIYRLGDDDYFSLIVRDIRETIESEKQIESLLRENQALRENVRNLSQETEMIGQCPAMKQLGKSIERVAKTDSSVLIVGETGTGKELVARKIHNLSERADNPLVCLNCAALPEELVESELFGHERGAFTGATSRREGRFGLANGGTLFLDEIGELPLNAQAKLLRTLQEGTYEPLGGNKTLQTDVRIVAATHRNLSEMVEAGTFREDLFFRLNVFPLDLPPLRDRGNDIALLAQSFLKQFARSIGRRFQELDEEHIQQLKAYDWPGNVRELQNTIERALIVSASSQIDLQSVLPKQQADSSSDVHVSQSQNRILNVDALKAFEKRNIERALNKAAGKISGQSGAAQLLGMKPTTLNSRIKALGIGS